MDLKRALAAAAALLATGCEIYSVPSPITCPGRRQGLFRFQGSTPGPICAWAAGQYNNPIEFPGSINFAEAPLRDAWLCIDAPHAVPRTGRYDTGTADPPTFGVDVSYASAAGVGNCTCPSEDARAAGGCTCPPDSPLSACNCPVVVTERITGTLQRLAGGTQFDGIQVVRVDPPSILPPGPACDCQLPCSFQYSLAGTPL